MNGNKINRRVETRRGAAAVAMLIVLILISLILIGLVRSGARDHDLTVRRVETVQSFYAAEAGMNMAIRELMLEKDEDGDGTIGAVSNDHDPSNDPTFGEASVYVSKSSDGDTVLISYGRCGAATRQRRATHLTEDASSN